MAFDGSRFASTQHDCLIHFYILEQLLNVQDMVNKDKSDKKEEQLNSLMVIYQSKGGGADE